MSNAFIAFALAAFVVGIEGCAAPPAVAGIPSTQPVTAVDLATRAKDVFEALEDRRTYGEALTPEFIFLYCEWSRRWAVAQHDAAIKEDKRQQAMAAHRHRIKALHDSISQVLDGHRVALLDYLVLAEDGTKPQETRDAIVDTCQELEDRRSNGEALNPEFLELLCWADRRLAEAQIALCQTATQRLAVADAHVDRIKNLFHILFYSPHDIPFLANQGRYQRAASQLWAAGIRSHDSGNAPATMPAAVTSNLVEGAKGMWQELTSSKNHNRFRLTYVEMECQYSRRWAEAQQLAPGNSHDRLVALKSHLDRMRQLRKSLTRENEEVRRVQESQAEYYVAEAQFWVEHSNP